MGTTLGPDFETGYMPSDSQHIERYSLGSLKRTSRGYDYTPPTFTGLPRVSRVLQVFHRNLLFPTAL